MKNKKGKFRSINVKILSIFLILSIMIIGSIIAIVYNQVGSLVRNNILETNLNVAENFMDSTYEGSWKIEGNQLYKGEHVINEVYEIVDEIKAVTGAEVTIFSGDTRVVTTIQQNGARQVGTQADERVVASVIEGGETYSGTADVLNETYVTMYAPIENNQNEIIGMLFVGYPNGYVLGIISKFISLIVMVSAVLLLLGLLVFAILVNRSILKPIKILNESLTAVSALDLTGDIDEGMKNRGDELGEMFGYLDQMVHNLRDITHRISSNSDHLYDEARELTATSEEMSASSRQVAISIDSVSDGTIEQSNSINEILGIVEGLSKAIDNVYTQMGQVRSEVGATEDNANKGKKDMDDLIKSIEKIQVAFHVVTDKIGDLNTSVVSISVIADVIKSISEQTNLLALNAAIESARAGEAGRGFAVVANEVKKLAEESKKSTDEIISIITSIQKDTKEVMVTSTDVGKYIKNQGESMGQAIRSFTSILGSIENIRPLIENTFGDVNHMIAYKDETNTKLKSMSDTIIENVSVVQEVNASTEEVASSSEEVAKSAEKLASVSVDLNEVIHSFKIQ